MPSLLTPKQLTRFSWPTRDPTFSPRVTSQTYQEYVSPDPNSLRCTRTYLALKIIVACKQETTGHGRGHRGDATQNRLGLAVHQVSNCNF